MAGSRCYIHTAHRLAGRATVSRPFSPAPALQVATDANDTAEAFGKVHVPLGPTGEGLYTLATVGCFNVMARCQPLVLEALPAALTAALAQPGRPLSICDFGAADGGTSVPMWHAVVAAARQSHTMDISMAYEDQARHRSAAFRPCPLFCSQRNLWKPWLHPVAPCDTVARSWSHVSLL